MARSRSRLTGRRFHRGLVRRLRWKGSPVGFPVTVDNGHIREPFDQTVPKVLEAVLFLKVGVVPEVDTLAAAPHSQAEGLNEVPVAGHAVRDQPIFTRCRGQHPSLMLKKPVHSEALRPMEVAVDNLRETRDLLHQQLVIIKHGLARW